MELVYCLYRMRTEMWGEDVRGTEQQLEEVEAAKHGAQQLLLQGGLVETEPHSEEERWR